MLMGHSLGSPLTSPNLNLLNEFFSTEQNEEELVLPGEDFFTGLPTDAELDELAEREFDADGGDS